MASDQLSGPALKGPCTESDSAQVPSLAPLLPQQDPEQVGGGHLLEVRFVMLCDLATLSAEMHVLSFKAEDFIN